MHRFCVMTTGRTGSTALMDAIAAGADVAVPARQLPDCRDHELLHPRAAASHARRLGLLGGRPIRSRAALVEAFFDLNGDRAFAGFKSMPNRHPDFETFTRREDLRVVTLLRRDRVSTAASFLHAETCGTWRRSGGTPTERLRVETSHRSRLLDNLAFLHRAERMLAAVPGAIRLVYEDLCDADFEAPELDRFFGRRIRLAYPRGATRAEDYVENFDAFERFVHESWSVLEREAEDG